MGKAKEAELIPPNIRAYIKQAVVESMEASRTMNRRERSAYQRTEARLYALPSLQHKVDSDTEELQRLEDGGKIQEFSKDLVRFTRGGNRITPEEKLDAVIESLRATIAADAFEIATMQKALKEVEDDCFYAVIPGKYINRESDEELGVKLHCDERTVRRHKNRLVNQLAVLLYGAEALD
jgi:hypothetical protein